MPSQTKSPRIFISYRHAESGFHAGRLYEQLEAHFGPQVVFIDTEDIQPGRDYMEVIEEEIRSCKILIAVIGQQWLACSDEKGRRLDDPEDLVRSEIAEALRQDVRVIPVLIQGAPVPRAQDLPDVLAPLARRQALRLSDDYWRQDVQRLIEKIEEDILPARAGEAQERGTLGTYLAALEKGQVLAGGGTLVAVIVALLLGPYVLRDSPIDNQSEIEKSVEVGVCTYECNKFTCPVVNRMENKKLTALEVELNVKPPNAAPDFKPVIVRSRLVLDLKDSGKPGTRSSYSALLDNDRTASVELKRVALISAANSQ